MGAAPRSQHPRTFQNGIGCRCTCMPWLAHTGLLSIIKCETERITKSGKGTLRRIGFRALEGKFMSLSRRRRLPFAHTRAFSHYGDFASTHAYAYFGDIS